MMIIGFTWKIMYTPCLLYTSSDVKKIATRASYGSALVELGKEHEDLVVLEMCIRDRTGADPSDRSDV